MSADPGNGCQFQIFKIMKARFFASVAVLVALVSYVAAILFGFTYGRLWPLIVAPVVLVITIGVANFIEYKTAEDAR